MYAIVETGGKQYRVSPGDTFEVEKLPAEKGTMVELDRVLLISDEGDLKVGAPMLAGAKILCAVVEQDRGKKIIALRYKSKKNVRVRRGHRQYFTRLLVKSIEA